MTADFCVEINKPTSIINLPEGEWGDAMVFVNGCLLDSDYSIGRASYGCYVSFREPIGCPVPIKRTLFNRLFGKQKFRQDTLIVMVVHKTPAQGCPTCGK